MGENTNTLGNKEAIFGSNIDFWGRAYINEKAVEEAVTTRYYLRSMGVEVSKPSIIYTDNLSTIKNSTDPSSPLKKKNLVLSYHFCREHFSAGLVNIR